MATPIFAVSDQWEVQWDSPSRLDITLLSPDRAVLAGVSSTTTGSFFQAKGGSFYLQVKAADHLPTPWHIRIVELGPIAPGAPAAGTADAPYFPPSLISPPAATDALATAAPPSSSSETNAATSPLPASPSSATNVVVAAVPALALAPPSTNAPPVATPAPATSAALTQDQSRAIVVIKGDAAEGTGFLAQTPDGPVVITNNHVLAANPNIKIFTSGGESITPLTLKGATDRDLVMISIKDNHYSYLDLATDIEHTVLTGDEVITPGNGQGGEVVLTTDGEVRGIGADRIEVSNPIYHGNSGGPIIHVKSGKVIGVVTMARKTRVTNQIDKSSYADAKSAITGTMRYFGFRIDSVPAWETYDWGRFLNETAFLKQFHLASRYLDSALNGAIYEKAGLTSEDPNDAMPNSKFYLLNDKLPGWFDTYHQLSGNAGDSQQLDAKRELVMNLQDYAAKDLSTMQVPANFYSFDQVRAKEEVAYRQALQHELDKIGNKISDLGH